jgi:hypothetical protein
MKDNPLISIITINCNQSAATNEFLESMQKVTWKNIEIIVVDNDSAIRDFRNIHNNYKNARIIRSEKNLGFAGGNNLGIVNSYGEYLLFINNDTEVEPDFLEPLVASFEDDLTLGLASPKIKFFNSPDKNTILYAGGSRPDLLSGISQFKGFMEPDYGKYDKSEYTDMIHGAAVMVPRRLLKETGIWPDIYFLYYEEIDLCETFKRKGFTLKYVHDSVVYHKESMLVEKTSVLRTYYMSRNRLLFIRRNLKGMKKAIGIIIYVLLSVPKNSLRFLIKSEFNLLKALWKGLGWHMTNFGNIHNSPILIGVDGHQEITDNCLLNNAIS